VARALERGTEPRAATGALTAAAEGGKFVRYALVRYQDERPEPFCAPLRSGGEAMVVFSSRVAAQDFLSLCAFEPEWCASGFSAPEMISLLVGPCSEVDWVLNDPFPGCLVGKGGAANLVHWHRCVDQLLG